MDWITVVCASLGIFGCGVYFYLIHRKAGRMLIGNPILVLDTMLSVTFEVWALTHMARTGQYGVYAKTFLSVGVLAFFFLIVFTMNIFEWPWSGQKSSNDVIG